MKLNQTMRQRLLVILLMAPLVLLSAFWASEIYGLSEKRAELKEDFSELNNIEYGLLSIEKWRDSITEIVAMQIDQFRLKIKHEEQLKDALDDILNALITQGEEMMDEKQKGLGNKLRKFAFKTFVDTDKIRERVPEFSETIIEEIKEPKNRETIKDFANEKLDDYADQTKDTLVEESEYRNIIIKYNGKPVEEINRTILSATDSYQVKIYQKAFSILGCMFIFLLVWILFRKQSAVYQPMFLLSVALALIVLFVGVFTPMIEIDARIKEINFLLLNKSIQFKDQVIFFQSKSIMDVVYILIKTKKFDSIFVGILIFVFSVVFPLTKLISTQFYLLGNKAWKKSRIIKFFAFESGKWSMADVMVVAIFMSYIGFKGILDTQLTGLNLMTPSISSITTNQTSLQPGFLLFISFVFFSLILSTILKRSTLAIADKKDQIISSKPN